MSQTDPQHDLPNPMHEELVAYLDGELDAASARQVEERFAADARYRAELNQLDRAWGCLDELPQNTVDERFTRTTVEMVALAASEDLAARQGALPRARRIRALSTMAVVAAAALAGCLLATMLWPNSNQQLLRDLPLLERLDAYLQIDDIAYLRMLKQDGFLNETRDAALQQTAAYPPGEESIAERRERIRQLSPAEQAQLANRQKRYVSLSPEQQAQVRKLHHEITADPDSRELLATLQRYQAWLQELSPGQQVDLLALDPRNRMQAVHRHHAEIQRRRSAYPADADLEVILKWFETHLAAYRERIETTLSPTQRQEYERLDDRLKRVMLMRFLWRQTGQGALRRVPWFGEEETRELVLRFSPAAQAYLRQLPSHEARAMTLLKWTQLALREKYFAAGRGKDGPQITAEALEKFFEKDLSSDQRELLLSLPAVEFERELRRLYVRGPLGEELDGHFRGGPLEHGRHPPPDHPGRMRPPHGPRRNTDERPFPGRRFPPPPGPRRGDEPTGPR